MSDLVEQMERAIRARDGEKTFYDTAAYPWIQQTESHWRSIQQESNALMSAIDFLPGFEEIQVEQKDLTNDKRWKIFPLYAYGQWVGRNARRCPETTRALRGIPGLQGAMFSILQAGKEIPAHRGPYSGVLRYHLGLNIPSPATSCGISVGGDIAHWKEGGSLLFDDTHMHHAWNHSSENRVVLFVDVTRPLPEDLAATNEVIIKIISQSDFITKAVAQWEAWDAVHGDQLDRHLLVEQTI